MRDDASDSSLIPHPCEDAMIQDVIRDVQHRMHGAIEALHREFKTLRTGRANAAMLDGITVDYYGSPTPISQLTEDRRKELVKRAHHVAEESRTAIRQVRRDGNEKLKKMLKSHEISEDDEKRALDEIQKMTDKHIEEA